MDGKKSIELIILEVLGCLEKDDRSNLQLLKVTDENFPWKTLAEFQNLSALFPSVLKISELPSIATKERMINKLNHSISSELTHEQPAKFTPGVGVKSEHKEQLEEILNKNKIDWGSLAVSNPSSKPVAGYEEVKPKAPSVKRDIKKFDETPTITEDLKSETLSDEELNLEAEVNIKSSPKLRRYVMISVILLIISLALSGYLFIFKQTDTTKSLVENKPDEKVVNEPVEEFFYNNIQGLENIQSAADDQQVETESKPENNTETETETKKETPTKENNKNILPKAPPKLPEPIEAPLIETAQVTTTEEEKNKEEMNVPPPKEVIKESEEPTYFVAVEEMPEPIGGLTAIQQKIVYPELARRAGVQGKVYIRAFVDENGNVTSAEVVKGIGGGCDEAALDAILKTKFSPGKQRGKPIKVQVTVPVLFKL